MHIFDPLFILSCYYVTTQQKQSTFIVSWTYFHLVCIDRIYIDVNRSANLYSAICRICKACAFVCARLEH